MTNQAAVIPIQQMNTKVEMMVAILKLSAGETARYELIEATSEEIDDNPRGELEVMEHLLDEIGDMRNLAYSLSLLIA